MKPRTQILLVLAALAAVAVLSSTQRKGNADRINNGGACCPLVAALDAKLVVTGTNQVNTNATAQQVIAYYFHGTVRCETCLLIEKLAKLVIEQEFSSELASDRLAFTPVNYELPENAHFLTDYKLPCPSLVLVRRTDGKERAWKLLGDTWQLVHEPIKLNAYVETEVRNFLNGTSQPASTNQSALPPAADDH
ncbi:MAG TPA: nitrophenyl compound nitroreductase subunit ArsF family protein [Candidatus Paceibacterota bacterium]|nr:nitrophenyl compound nitroreductase subunit ArsF family protein [Verrucomicrobiota bacterium]HSA10614.1 nitrophenyl compound nitroreductase subunit ArsF family protein [Candidatus Paceibacterota bacterium]